MLLLLLELLDCTGEAPVLNGTETEEELDT